MSFGDDLLRFVVRTKTRTRALHAAIATKVHESVVEGHPATGAPGQPVDTSNLKTSWTLAIAPQEATISTNVDYAPAIEDGVGPHGPLTLRSPVGGFHSVKLTVAGASALQREALAEVGD
jgi:hypothetical protein